MLYTNNIIHSLMKAFASVFAACMTAATLPVSAGPFTSTITDTAVISVQGSGIQMTRVGSEYKASGVGIDLPASPGFATNGTANSYTPTSNTGTFQFSESYREADTPDQTFNVAVNTGAVTPINMYGEATIQYAGTVGSGTSMTMPLLQTTTGPTSVAASGTAGPTITLGATASGVTATAQRSISLTVFD